MPKGYVIARVDVHDPEQYSKYAAKTPGSIAAAGGRFIVRGGRQECLEGEAGRSRTVIIEFDSYDAAKAWFDAAEYQEIRQLRLPASQGDLLLVEGYDG